MCQSAVMSHRSLCVVSDGHYRTVEATTKQQFPLKVANRGLNMQYSVGDFGDNLFCKSPPLGF